jgi:hypothetical protein
LASCLRARARACGRRRTQAPRRVDDMRARWFGD